MAIASYDVGDLVELKCTFKNDAGVDTDPSTVSLRVRKPDTTTTTYTYVGGTVTKSATGVYLKNVTPDQDGLWYYRFVGTGPVAQEEEGSFFVRPSNA